MTIPVYPWQELGVWAEPDPCTIHLHWVFYSLLKFRNARHPQQTVEIGIGRGYGTYLFGMFAKEEGGHHAAIDVASAPIQRAVKIRDKFDLPVEVIQADSKEVDWTGKPIDLIFIDGNHTYDGVIGDIDNFVHLVRRNGLVFFHDYHNQRWEVKRAVDERFDQQKHEMLELPYTSIGCAVWRVK